MSLDRPRGLFGSCGVRGVVGETITDEVVERLAQAFAQTLGPGRRVCVGRDTRRSGPMLEDKLVQELVRYGLHVVRLGVLSTPGVYFLTRELGFDAGVAVTASHNPPEYNGFKLCNHLGMWVDQEPIERAFFGPVVLPSGPRGTAEFVDGAETYYSRLEALCPPPLRPLRLVVDCACGPHSLHMPDILRRQGHEVIAHNCVPDIEKCDRDPEPMARTLARTIALVRDRDADGAVCYDGDNDRVVFLDRDGFIGLQQANAAMAMTVLSAAVKKVAVGSVETGRFVEEAVKSVGGTLIRTVVGDIHVAETVRRHSAALGMEECGHYIIARLGYFSETVFPTALMLASHDLTRVRQELADMPTFHAREVRLDCVEADKPRVMEFVSERLAAVDAEVNDIDGIRVDWEDGWLLVRPSGTSPYMKVNAEAVTEERLEELIALGTSLVQEAPR